MQITNIHEAKTRLSQLIERVQAGEEVIIGKAEYRLRSSFATMKATNFAGRGSGAER